MFVVAAFYAFAPLRDPDALRAPLRDLAACHGVRGSILVASEGVNGTIAGPRAGIEATLAHIRDWPGCADLDWKESAAAEMPFGRLKVRLKREIVTMGVPVDPDMAGHYVDPSEWNALIAAPDVAVIDTRNAYEVAMGSFEGAVDPGTAAFGDFPAWWRANRDRYAGKRIAMFCTGGIRCEKATAYLRSEGVEDVSHLKGGILKYLEEVPERESRWRGECFVFDGRVTVGHGLAPGTATICHACRRPLGPEDRAHPLFEEGARCAHCAEEYTEAQRARFRERHRQVELARARGKDHLGPAAAED
ncbi:rhodanese-related sulfurtransferase [Palleronia sp. LCG004]|uniref:oxygen-dependent tRNA uridine(34) hydroxylase TrhO n=1 Tax=Palleronia sp. LCG004 TaxID=3079304 RepID=UPI0029426D82|nr:rhodanese-related sulfurtransferase [Palleronia sp. LCG004]WOI55579.1 rhodanese-related sulfurtransferase [Palleronia sp. LCG004]